ncbi:Spo0E family sporulation regulatory protein-aspartic acid phosphatase [Sporosarcina sp. NPDC096371]|uniref:Spo0E family sporulation regulatory protein-aspartic acid phosphatase n=1 Tax=Sporosarcina sp. NPDC096371 TaxID=3364530 RepID=UPI0037F2A1DE
MIKLIPRKRILSKQIKLKQHDMYAKANLFGFTHPIVIACSQELDGLLNRYQGFQSN